MGFLGACPFGCLLTLPFRNPAGGLLSLLPANLALPESVGGACLFGCPPTLPLVFFPAPIPPTPFPSGEGGES